MRRIPEKTAICDIIAMWQAIRRRHLMNIRDRLKNAIYKLRNPERDENEAEFQRRLGTKRLYFLLPFLIVAVILLLISFK